MPYLTYNEYKGYGGELSEKEFVLYEIQARKQIDYWTAGRVQSMKTIPETVKLCMMQIIKVDKRLGAEAQVENPVVSSFNTDGYSESYGGVSDQVGSARAALFRSARNLLYNEFDDYGTPLLYRGVSK